MFLSVEGIENFNLLLFAISFLGYGLLFHDHLQGIRD